jgi:hypothetical protein
VTSDSADRAQRRAVLAHGLHIDHSLLGRLSQEEVAQLLEAHYSNRNFAVLGHEKVFLALADPVLTGAGAVGGNCQLCQPLNKGLCTRRQVPGPRGDRLRPSPTG